jgi:hypothetical protein
MADVHLGGWKYPELQELNFKSFQKAIKICIEEKIDFLLIAGDLFDTAYPPIEILKETFAEFKKLKDSGIPCFLISGSHDYSVSGKTFLDVLEKAGFCKNVADFEDDGETVLLKPTVYNEIIIYGYPGKKSGLDVHDLKRIKLSPCQGKYKILMLHTTIDTVVGDLPIETISVNEIPETDYCALGHIHVLHKHKQFVYPGPVFPNNFAELELLSHGHFCIVNTENNEMKRIELKFRETEKITVHIEDGLTATEKILLELEKRDLNEKIILLRIKGELENSKNSDIKYSRIEEFAKNKGAYILLRNTHELKIKEVEFQNQIEQSDNIEDEVINLYSSQNPSDFNKLLPLLLDSLSAEKQEAETSDTFSRRIFEESKKILSF